MIFRKRFLIPLAMLASIFSFQTTIAEAATVRLTVDNIGGTTPVTPVFAAFHDGTYELARRGGTASAGLERLAEVGDNSVIATEFGTANGRVSNPMVGAGPITPGGSASFDFTINTTGTSNSFLSVASMVLPSSDYFFATANNAADPTFGVSLATLFATGTQTFTLSTVYDAGTEVNDFATSAPPIPAAAPLFAGGPFAALPNSDPGMGMLEGGTIQAVATPFAGFANSPFAVGSEPLASSLRFTLTDISAVPEPSAGFATCMVLGTVCLRRRRKTQR